MELACGCIPAKLGNFLILVITRWGYGGCLWKIQILQTSSLQRGKLILSPTLAAFPHINAKKELIVYMWYWGQNLKQTSGQTTQIKPFPKLEQIHINLLYCGVNKVLLFLKSSLMSVSRWWWEGGWGSQSFVEKQFQNIWNTFLHLCKFWQCEERIRNVEMCLGWLKGWGFISCNCYHLKAFRHPLLSMTRNSLQKNRHFLCLLKYYNKEYPCRDR